MPSPIITGVPGGTAVPPPEEHGHFPPITLADTPVPTPLVTEGDQLYQTYRNGIVTRHIAKNGRFLEWVALQSIDDAGDHYWLGFDGTVSVKDSRGRTHTFPIANARYSMEQPAGTLPKAYLWVPLVAPLKYPGYTSDAYDVIAASGDNPNYYGGMALAAFCMEKLHGVSTQSMEYARRLVGFMLCSEIPAFGGYIARRARAFNTDDNPDGSPCLRGGSAEEVLGTMLGLMFYLRAEDPAHPLHGKAKALRDRILAHVDAAVISYDHPYFTKSFPIAHFDYPIFAAAGIERGTTAEQSYRLVLENRPFIGGLGNHYDYALFLTSMILIMESDLADKVKEKWAGRFFDFMKNALTGPDAESLDGNSYLGVALLMINRYRNPQRNPRRFNPSDDGLWLSAALDSANTVGRPTSASGARAFWEHDLPFQSKCADESSDDVSLNMHRPGAIGAHFEWVLSPPYHRHDPTKWWSVMPGWTDLGSMTYEGIPATAMNAAEYIHSDEKRYGARGYADRELVARGHHNTQIEGAGLGLFFLRMLASHVDANYPPPVLASDVLLPSLAIDGVEPLPPVTLRCASVYDGRHPTGGGPTKMGGDRPKSVAMATLDQGRIVVTACARDSDEHLRLDSWTPSNGALTHAACAYGERFDLVALAPLRSGLFVVAERAEKHHAIVRDDHWLRLSLWRASPALTRLAEWESTTANPDSSDPSSVGKLDIAAIDGHTVVVMSKSQNGINRLRVFTVSDNPPGLTPVTGHPGFDAQDGSEHNSEDVCVLSARNGLVIHSVHWDDRVHFVARRWVPGSATLDVVQRTEAVPGRLLDATVVSAIGRGSPEHVVAVLKEGDFLTLHAWKIEDSGLLISGGGLRTAYGADLLLSREKDYESAWIASRGGFTEPWFVVAGNGCAVSLKQGGGSGSWTNTGRGIKLLHGRVLPSGQPTIEGISLAGGGSGAPDMLAVAASTLEGAYILNKSPDGDYHLRRWDVIGELRS